MPGRKKGTPKKTKDPPPSAVVEKTLEQMESRPTVPPQTQPEAAVEKTSNNSTEPPVVEVIQPKDSVEQVENTPTSGGITPSNSVNSVPLENQEQIAVNISISCSLSTPS